MFTAAQCRASAVHLLNCDAVAPGGAALRSASARAAGRAAGDRFL
jgi:hypothetical protein